MVQLVIRQCTILKYWLNERRIQPYHVTYMSRCSQNEFIKLIVDAVRHRIVRELEEAPAFSVMADTTNEHGIDVEKFRGTTQSVCLQSETNTMCLICIPNGHIVCLKGSHCDKDPYSPK